MTKGRLRVWVVPFALSMTLPATTLVVSQPPETAKVSSFAPAKDLILQADFFIRRVEESLADPTDFDLAKQSRTLKDGNTLAVLALVLAVHDEEHPIKAAMPAMLKASQDLAGAGADAQRAGEALSRIKQARAGASEAAARVKALGDWQQVGKVASLPALMKQVPLVHTRLKRGVEPNRLARQAAQSAGQAATLAAIAQASMLDHELAKTPEEIDYWVKLCAAMRDAAGEVNSAVHAQDQARVEAGMKRLTVSCDKCHATFRKQEMSDRGVGQPNVARGLRVSKHFPGA